VKRELKSLLNRCFSRFVPYQIALGGWRYYKATQENCYKPEEFLHFGKNARIEAGVAIAAPERLYIGDNVGISQGCYINAVGGCHIGRACEMAQETIILTVEHRYMRGTTLPYDVVRLVKPVYIEDYVWIGTRSCIAPGVRIGEGSIIGMGSVVAQDVPPLAIVMGNPAQVLMFREKDDFDRLKRRGTDIDPYKELSLLMVPPVTRRKYKNEIEGLGFDLSNGHTYFRYDKHANNPRARLTPIQAPESDLRSQISS
jgi:acetyltransferase-like isoleucine patch superfamily enzyme